MELKFETVDKEKSQVLLKITVDQKEVKKEYDSVLLETQKNAQIDGFRKGKIPVSVLEAKYKDGILAEASSLVIDKAYKDAIEKVTKKPIPYAMPKLDNFTLPVIGKDYSFELTYDVYPTFTVIDLSKIDAEKDEVKIKDEDINEHIAKLIGEFATIEPKDGPIELKDMANVDYIVFHDGKEYYKKEGEYIYTDKDFDMFKLGKDIIGLKKGEEKEFEKTYSDKEVEQLAGKTFKIKLNIKEVKQEKKPALDDKLANEINTECKTVTELKTSIKKELETYAEASIKDKILSEAINKLVESFTGDIPESMIENQINLYFKEIINRVGGDEKRAAQLLKMQNLTPESYKEKMKEPAIRDIKRMLILQDIVEKQKIEITEDEVKDYAGNIAKSYKMDVEKLLNIYKSSNQMSLIENEVKIKKAIDFLHNTIKIKKGKKINFADLNKHTENNEE